MTRDDFREVINPSSSSVATHHVSLVRSRRANWFVLDSPEKTLQTPGLLGAEQLGWLARSLDENPGKPA